MATFVLVHGAWHGSWCWKRVRKRLQERGHDVHAPTLSGVGERAHLLSPEIDLQTHIDDIANLIRWEELSDIVLCGHSYGGCVITGVADALADRIGALVYLDAFILEDGQGLYDVLAPELRQVQIDATEAVGDGWKVPPIPAETFNVNEADRAWVDRQCTWHPAAAFTQGIRLTGAGDRISNVHYIGAKDFPDSPFPPFLQMARRRRWRVSLMDCGHDIMVDMPDALADALESIAGKAGQSSARLAVRADGAPDQ